MSNVAALATVPGLTVNRIPEGVSGKARPGRKPSNHRLQAIAEKYGTEAAFDAKIATLRAEGRVGDALVLNMEIQKRTSQLKQLEKNGGKPGLRGRAPKEARVEAVFRLFGKTYEEFRNWSDSLPVSEKVAASAKVAAFTALLEAGVVLNVEECEIFADLEPGELELRADMATSALAVSDSD